MFLYINGDSHSAGAEAANTYCFANDDFKYRHLGRKAHPDNLLVSYGSILAKKLNAKLICDAESSSSNARIIRTTRDFLKYTTPDIIVIGWATWEREEWNHNGIYYQVTAGGTDIVPDDLKKLYKDWVIRITNQYALNEIRQHEIIWNFHLELEEKCIPHFFFNTYNTFAHVRLNNLQQYDWGPNYLDPYSEAFTYYNWLKDRGCQTVNSQSYHFGIDAHEKWAEFLLPHLTRLL